MNRRVRNILAGVMTACALAIAAPMGGISSWAASARISFSDPNVTVGQEFNVTVRITSQDGNLGASDVMLSYDPAGIEFISGNNASGGAGSVRLVETMSSNATTEFTHTLKFKALQAGTTTISVGSYEIYDVDAQAVNVTKTGSSAVSVNAPATYSSEAALSSLKVSPGQLAPPFSPDVTAYSVNVGSDVSKLAVSASAKDGKAKVVVNGDSNLQTGANTVVCKVTAEDGRTTRSYTLTVNKAESGEAPAESIAEEPGGAEQPAGADGQLQTVEQNGTTYELVPSFDAALIPEGYSQSTISYGGQEVMCAAGNGVNLLYFQDAGGSGTFFVYTPESGSVSPYAALNVAARSLVVLMPEPGLEVPSGFTPIDIELLDGAKLKNWGWKNGAEDRYFVIYGMNENGEKGLYRYDKAEMTFQRYFDDSSAAGQYDGVLKDLPEQYNALVKDYNLRFIVIIALIAVCLLLFFIVINLLVSQRNRAREPEEEALTPVKRRALEEERKREEERLRQAEPGRSRPAGRSGWDDIPNPQAYGRAGASGSRRPDQGQNTASLDYPDHPARRLESPMSAWEGHSVRRGDYQEEMAAGRAAYREEDMTAARRAGYSQERVYSGRSDYRDRDMAGAPASAGRRERTVSAAAETGNGMRAGSRSGPGTGAGPGRDRRPAPGYEGERPRSTAPGYPEPRDRKPASSYPERQGAVSSARPPYQSAAPLQAPLSNPANRPPSARPARQEARPAKAADASASRPRPVYRPGAAAPGRPATALGRTPSSPLPSERRSPDRPSRSAAQKENNVPRKGQGLYESPRMRDPGLEIAIRQREIERGERARKTRERMEQARAEEQGLRAARNETAAGLDYRAGRSD